MRPANTQSAKSNRQHGNSTWGHKRARGPTYSNSDGNEETYRGPNDLDAEWSFSTLDAEDWGEIHRKPVPLQKRGSATWATGRVYWTRAKAMCSCEREV